MLIREASLGNERLVGVWCVMTTIKTTGPIFKSINLYQYVTHILTQLSSKLQTMLSAVYSVFGDRLTSKGLWPPHSLGLKPCDFIYGGMLKVKYLAIMIVLKTMEKKDSGCSVLSFNSRISSFSEQRDDICDACHFHFHVTNNTYLVK
jgi:hypothetical protein